MDRKISKEQPADLEVTMEQPAELEDTMDMNEEAFNSSTVAGAEALESNTMDNTTPDPLV